MPSWNSDQYLKFADERTQPAVDLARRIALAAPARVIDLGCGPGNSAAVVAQRWPGAEITGLDSSAAMLAAARREHPTWSWREGEIGQWAAQAAFSDVAYELVFSNAALQWAPEHRRLLPNLFQAVAPGGALAFQVPHSLEAPHQRCIRDLGAAAEWRTQFTHPPISWHVEAPEFYYDLLAPLAQRVDLWLTDYVHVLPAPEAIVEWHRGTGLRPFLDALPNDEARDRLIAAYLAAIRPHYPRRADGRVLMPFRRLFVIAYR